MGWSGLLHPMELIVPPHGKDSEKALSKEREGTFTGARRHLNRKKNDEKNSILAPKMT
jgi:hypothetical protein